jgi:hypothetical protein
MVDNDLKKQIDEMSHYEMCRVWRFSETGNVMLQGEAGDYFYYRLFKHYGGFTPEISKSLGWDK